MWGANDVDSDNNELTQVDLGGISGLEVLYVHNNNLGALDVSGCRALRKLNADNNELQALDLKGKPSLVLLSVRGNKLRSIDMSGCGSLEEVHADGNELATVEMGIQPLLTCSLSMATNWLRSTFHTVARSKNCMPQAMSWSR